ncbi:MAG: LCP family protein [Bacillota bacterium]|nr:LCP family protein [Bacillota bacterium]
MKNHQVTKKQAIKKQAVKKKPKKLTKKNKRVLMFAIPAVIFLVVVIAVGSYVASLINLVKPPDFTGDATLHESDIFEPDDYVTTTTGTTTAANHTTRTTGKPGDPTTIETTIETTIDPVVILAEEHDAALSSLPMAADNQVYNILLIGTDNRGNELNGRSDAMLILSVNKRTDKIQIVSLMRALYVKIPGREHSMLNAAFSWGGASLLKRTVEENFRIPIHDYIVINFYGFEQVIDQIGGITISLTEAEIGYLVEKNPGAVLQVGENSLNGRLALWYARTRKIDSDFTRTSRQRIVMETLIRKIGQMSLSELDGLARQILPLVKSSRTGSSMLALVADAYAWRNYPIRQMMIPINNSYKSIVVRGVQMYRFDVTANVEKLQQFLYK